MKSMRTGLRCHTSMLALKTAIVIAAIGVISDNSAVFAQNTTLGGPSTICAGSDLNIVITSSPNTNTVGCDVTQSVIIGSNSQVGDDADAAVAIGRVATVTGQSAIAIGNATTAAEDGLAIGRSSKATGRFSTAIGVAAEAAEDALALGRASKATETAAIAVGIGAEATNIDSIAIGPVAKASGRSSVSIGIGSEVSSTNSVAIGVSAKATGSGSVVIGSVSDDGGLSNVVSIGSSSVKRKIINVANGSIAAASSEAVTGAQLFSTNSSIANSLGAGAAVSGSTGVLTGPSFTVVGGTFTNVGSALDAMDTEIAKAIVYDNAGHTTATLGGAGATTPVSLRNLDAGNLSSTSTDAVNGGQLFSTNQKVDANTAHINATLSGLGGGAGINAATGAFTGPSFNILGSSFANVGEALAALDNELTGAVFYDDKARSRATLGGAGVTAPVSLQNLAAGALNASSTEAVNGSQLFVTNENLVSLTTRVDDAESNFSNLNRGIANATVGIVQQEGGVSAGGVIRIGAASGGTSLSALGTEGVRVLSGLGAARLTIDSDEAVTGAQLFATNLLIQGNTEAIDEAVVSIGDTVSNVTNLTTAIQSGTIGLVQQDPTNLNIAVGADVGGNLVNIAGTDGNRVLAGLSAAALNASSTEAVNGAQLFATNQQIEGAIEDIGAIDVRVTDIETSLGDNINSVTNLTTAIQNGTIGLVQQDLSTRNLSVGSATDGLTVNFAGTAGNRKLTGIAAGTVSQNSTEAVNGAQLFTTDQTANNALRSATAAANGVSGAALALGGGARFDAASGNFTAPTFAVAGGTFNDVGSALLALDDEISNVSVAANNAVQYDNPERSAVTLGGQGAAVPVALRNVQAGTLTATSTDAVNGSQLFATNQAVAANTSAITNIDRRVTNLEGSVNGSNQAVQNLTTAIQNGTIGLVQQDPATQDINVATSTGGTVVNIAGTSGSRIIRGVKAGAIGANSSEAVNGSQLFALQQSIDSGLSKVDNRLNSLDSRIGNVELDLRELRGEMNSAVASAIAIGMLPTSTNPGRFTLGMGTGVRAGQMATALGLSYRTTDDMFTMQARAAFDKEAVSVGVGMGLEF